MSLKEAVVKQLDFLDETRLQLVADYLAFLRFQKLTWRPSIPDDETLAELYAEFAEEDRALAEEGIEDYAQALSAEDAQ